MERYSVPKKGGRTRQCSIHGSYRGSTVVWRTWPRGPSLTWSRPSVLLPPVAKITVAGALHDGLREPELYVWAETLSEREVSATDQQESQFRLAQLLVEFCVPASSDVDLISILRLCADAVVEGIARFPAPCGGVR